MKINRQWMSILALIGALLLARSAMAADLMLNVGRERTWTTEELLARPDAATIEVPGDVSYQRTMTYRAVPLRALLGDERGQPGDEDLQITGKDGFVAHIPAALVFNRNAQGAVPWLAIEPPGKPWPKTPSGMEAGPFYVVWVNPAASSVLQEQWPFEVASIRLVQAHALRWPQLVVGNDVPPDSPVRHGQTLFATQCMVCHRMNGAGDSLLGPDLNVPHNPTDYFQPWALKAYIRNPASIRSWPEMKMPGFEPAAMSDAELDAVIAYLKYMSKQR
jgi:mono/diheme cytochrome c family protein